MFATTLSDRPDWLEMLSYQAIGLLVVFTVLGSIWASMELMGAIFRRMQPVSVPTAPPPPALPPEPELLVPERAAAEMSPGLRVAIIAAVSIALEKPVRVVSCTERIEAYPSEFNVQMLSYASDGRRRQLDSHRLR